MDKDKLNAFASEFEALQKKYNLKGVLMVNVEGAGVAANIPGYNLDQINEAAQFIAHMFQEHEQHPVTLVVKKGFLMSEVVNKHNIKL